MIPGLNKVFSWQQSFIFLLVFLLLSALCELKAQEPPPRPVKINATGQTLGFGAFSHGPTGGTVIIDPSGSRSATGDVILLGLGYTFSPALFEVHAHPGTVISVLADPSYTLFGVPAGNMILHIGNTIPPSPFVSTVKFSIAIPLLIGGTLVVGSSVANPPGSYSGTYEITLVRE